MINPITVTQALIAFDTANPPGNEAECAHYLETLLAPMDFSIKVHQFGPRRMSLVATLAGTDSKAAPLVFTGHIDTVPNGAAKWSDSPLSGLIKNGKIYGRGSSDMKSGIAAMIAACEKVTQNSQLRRGITLILTGGEETGCEGAVHLVREEKALLGEASALIVGEPTGNSMVLAHKGALWLEAKASGVTAHSSMPDRGDNAIYHAARSICLLEAFDFNVKEDEVFGLPTLNVGMINGGLNINSVPDSACFSIDIRSTPAVTHSSICEQIEGVMNDNVKIDILADMPALSSPADSDFAVMVANVLTKKRQADEDRDHSQGNSQKAAPFFTDASILTPFYECPTVILGPGEPTMAHQTDEYCFTDNITSAAEIYSEIIAQWCT
jgi:succinyl-diaminopimelate desuccinylase